ncbi:hypothetical protein L9F63_022241, partial [Diploptera punctata]
MISDPGITSVVKNVVGDEEPLIRDGHLKARKHCLQLTEQTIHVEVNLPQLHHFHDVHLLVESIFSLFLITILCLRLDIVKPRGFFSLVLMTTVYRGSNSASRRSCIRMCRFLLNSNIIKQNLVANALNFNRWHRHVYIYSYGLNSITKVAFITLCQIFVPA